MLDGSNTFTGNIYITNAGVIDALGGMGGLSGFSGLGNPETAGHYVVVEQGGVLDFAGGGNPFSYGYGSPSIGFIVGPGGVVVNQGGTTTIGPWNLQGGMIITAAGAGGGGSYTRRGWHGRT